ncbi:hypothetical protein TspCOW1_25910 [Thiohalobacter sp. COW1]|uniref:Chorismate synthase n=1 Tax=Thiohalobacter thiocyanaticus TaxID=585455 RepID=A0A1Z4VLQ5_9GAMM|nr:MULTISPECIES: hypothetical protein [Thiohalobacter]BAZ92529.1 chorismate synthase [Thiohalobacter thiocyanaticus]BCO32488.1 hypothetical protein TspCOW1_25910 [Thiohalobacter sp. COW1]
MIPHNEASCIQAVNRLYCYLRHAGLDAQAACEQVQARMQRILDTRGSINPARLTHEPLPAVQLRLPQPASAPAVRRGHLGYPAVR